METRLRFHYKQFKIRSAVFWDVTPYGSCKNWRIRGTCLHYYQGEKNQRARSKVSNNQQPKHAAKNIMLLPWRWRRYELPKRWFLHELHGVTSQTMSCIRVKIFSVFKKIVAVYSKSSVKYSRTYSVAFSPQVRCTDWATATGLRILVPNFWR
jgi:hypothetical protein